MTGLKIIDGTVTSLSQYLRELEERKIVKTKMFSWDETQDLLKLKEKELIEEFEKMTYKLQSDMNVLDEQEIHLDIDKWEDFKQQLQELKEKSKWKLNLI